MLLWDLYIQGDLMVTRACEIVDRNFTKSEWQEYMGKRPYSKVCPKLPGPDDADWPFKTGQQSHPPFG